MRTRPEENMDELTERYVGRRLSTLLKYHIDAQTIQSTRKAKLRLLFILMVIAALVAFVFILSRVGVIGK